MTMLRDSDGYWTGDVQCDAFVDKDEKCNKSLKQAKIRKTGLLELGWRTRFGLHYCPDHSAQADEC